MKTPRISLTATIAGAAVMLAASSCSLMERSGLTKPSTQTPAAQQVEVPQDRRPVVPERVSATYTPEELRRGVVKGDWAIEEVNGHRAAGQTAPFIKFEPSQKRIYGNNGCNTLNGTYAYSPKDSTLTFSDLITTMMACDGQNISDLEINQALNNTRTYSWSANEQQQYRLYLRDATGRVVLVLMHQNFDFLNGTWLVQSIKDKKINVPGAMLSPDMKLVIDVPERKVHGNTGCNIFNGAFEVDMEIPNRISFQNMAATMRACPSENDFEMDMMVALEEATTAHPVDSSTVELLNSRDKVIMVLRRTTDN